MYSTKGHAANNARGATSVTRRNGNKTPQGFAAVYPGTAGFILPKAAIDGDGIVDVVTAPGADVAADAGTFDGIAAAGTPKGQRKKTSGMYRSGVVPAVNVSATTFKPYTRLRYKKGTNQAPRSTIDFHGIPQGTEVYVPHEVTSDSIADDLHKSANLKAFLQKLANFVAPKTGIPAGRLQTVFEEFIFSIGGDGKAARKLLIEAVQRAARADVICLDQWPSGHWGDVLLARR